MAWGRPNRTARMPPCRATQRRGSAHLDPSDEVRERTVAREDRNLVDRRRRVDRLSAVVDLYGQKMRPSCPGGQVDAPRGGVRADHGSDEQIRPEHVLAGDLPARRVVRELVEQ